ncbi:hypothetical protein [Acinetobacter sp.]|uniref:hypothetical protein n=1 Tax=Acinetobacter sp. TaxID=472 RepID=UPI003890B59E
MLTFKERQVEKVGLVVDVYLTDGNRKPKKIGTIYRVNGGWQYQVTKKHVGEIFPTVEAVKKSLV